MRRFEKLNNDGTGTGHFENKSEAEANRLKSVRNCKWREVAGDEQPKISRQTAPQLPAGETPAAPTLEPGTTNEPLSTPKSEQKNETSTGR